MLLVQRAICANGKLSYCLGCGCRDSNPVQYACYWKNLEALKLMAGLQGFADCVTSTKLLHGLTCPQLLLFSDRADLSISYEILRDLFPAFSLTQLSDINCSLAMYAVLNCNIGLACELVNAGLVDFSTRDIHGRSLVSLLAARPAADIELFTQVARGLSETDKRAVLTQLVARENSSPSAIESVPESLLSSCGSSKATWGPSLRPMTKLLLALDSKKEHAGEFARFLLTKYGDEAKELLDLLLCGGNNKAIVTRTMLIAASLGLRLSFGSLLNAAIDEKIVQSVLASGSVLVTPMEYLITKREFRVADLQRAHKALMAEISPMIDEANKLVQSARDGRSSAIQLRNMSSDLYNDSLVGRFSRSVDDALAALNKLENLATLEPFFLSACANVAVPNIEKLEFLLKLSNEDGKLAERLESIPRNSRGSVFFASPAISRMITEECPDTMLGLLIYRIDRSYTHGGRHINFTMMRYSNGTDQPETVEAAEAAEAETKNWNAFLSVIAAMPLGSYSLPSGIKVEGETGVGQANDLNVTQIPLNKALSDQRCFKHTADGVVPYIEPDVTRSEEEHSRLVATIKLAGNLLGCLLRSGKAIQSTPALSPVILKLLGNAQVSQCMRRMFTETFCNGNHLLNKKEPTTTAETVDMMLLTFMSEVPPELRQRIVAMTGETLTYDTFSGFIDVMENVMLGPDVLGPYIRMMREGFKAGLLGQYEADVYDQLTTAFSFMSYETISKIFGSGEIAIDDIRSNTVYPSARCTQDNPTVIWFWDIASRMSDDDKKLLLWYCLTLFTHVLFATFCQCTRFQVLDRQFVSAATRSQVRGVQDRTDDRIPATKGTRVLQ
jgi:hypothetical protein